MFTGIIEEVGRIAATKKLTDGIRLTITAVKIMEDIAIDHSICIDGVCQTVVGLTENSVTVEAVGETLDKTTLGDFSVGRPVNLERSLTLKSRLDGHMVLGHVNGTGTVTKRLRRGDSHFLKIRLPNNLLRYCILEGSIAVDGISLTIAHVEEDRIGLNIIPHTNKSTTLQLKKVGDRVNIETDVIARYMERLLRQSKNSGLTIEKLKNWGY